MYFITKRLFAYISPYHFYIKIIVIAIAARAIAIIVVL